MATADRINSKSYAADELALFEQPSLKALLASLTAFEIYKRIVSAAIFKARSMSWAMDLNLQVTSSAIEVT